MDRRIMRKIGPSVLIPIPITRYNYETAAKNWGGGYLAGIKAGDNTESHAAGVLSVLEISGYDVYQPWLQERVADCRDVNLLKLWISQIPTSNYLDELTDFLPGDFVVER